MAVSNTVFRYLKNGNRVICPYNLEEIIKQGDLPRLKRLVAKEPELVFAYSEPLSMTPLFYAVEYQQLSIAKYLLSCGANPRWVNMRHFNLVEFSRKNGAHTPLSRLFKSKLQLNQNTQNQLLSGIRKILQYEIASAKRANKKIMILLGEAHGNYVTYEVEKLFLKAAKELGVSDLFYEFPKQFHLDKPITRFAQHKLRMNIHKIDNHPRRDDASTQERNVVMVNEITNQNQHGVAIVGTSHLKGMLEKGNSLFDTRQFHIVPFNLCELAKQQYSPYNETAQKSAEMIFAEDSTKVIQVNIQKLSDPTQVVKRWNTNKKNNPSVSLRINIVPIMTMVLSVLAACLFGWIAPLGAMLACVIPTSYFCIIQYFKIQGLRNYQNHKSNLAQYKLAQLQAFVDGTQNTVKHNMQSCFSLKDWRFMQDYYAGRATAETGNEQFIKKVKTAKKAKM